MSSEPSCHLSACQQVLSPAREVPGPGLRWVVPLTLLWEGACHKPQRALPSLCGPSPLGWLSWGKGVGQTWLFLLLVLFYAAMGAEKA